MKSTGSGFLSPVVSLLAGTLIGFVITSQILLWLNSENFCDSVAFQANASDTEVSPPVCRRYDGGEVSVYTSSRYPANLGQSLERKAGVLLERYVPVGMARKSYRWSPSAALMIPTRRRRSHF
ncbi:hypothetical protein HPB51_023863 [Rhipicephalus microplus]|uniref:Uncharacterized protein n=1 Tax=Rhipicephalus microplus TaxID=6941 RepID=A0A9J6F8Q7_RHIMP|nr:hypothetical protein HPB51_023863 [Rhipicephalus microplus]